MLRKSSEKEILLEVWTGEDFVKGLETKVGLEDSDVQRREKEMDYPTAWVVDLNANSLRLGAMLYPLTHHNAWGTQAVKSNVHKLLKERASPILFCSLSSR